MEVNGPDISRYGVVVPSANGSRISGLIEKPEAQDAPSNLASIGRYVLEADIFKFLRELPKGAGDEIQLADAINIKAKFGSVEAVKLQGVRHDCGNIHGFIQANNYMYKKILGNENL